jgi:hypothetical protein
MGLDVGKVTIEHLPRPAGLANDFAWHLAEKASCSGEGNAFGFYRRSELEEQAKTFASELGLDEIKEWIGSLPWGKSGYLILTFNW